MPNSKLFEGICPNCNKTLLTDKVTIDGEKTVHFKVSAPGKNIELFMSSIFNNFKLKVLPEGEKIDKGLRVKIFCPHCEEELPKIQAPYLCGGDIYYIIERPGLFEHVYFCNTNGCHEQKMQEEKIPTGNTPASP